MKVIEKYKEPIKIKDLEILAEENDMYFVYDTTTNNFYWQDVEIFNVLHILKEK